jgi:hypothetical protein
MIDPVTGLTILGGAFGGAKVVEKILGPTADYVGNQIKEWTEKKVNNTSKIFQNAEKKLGFKIEEPGKVPPKVLKGILEEGSWCEEELQVEYFGGVLASSRSGISRDDRGAYFVSLVTRLSTYQLRTHYAIYTAIKNHFDGQDMNIGESTDRTKMEIYIPFSSYINAMDYTTEEMGNFDSLMTHSLWGLYKEELIENFSYGSAESLKINFSGANESGFIIQPSNLGIELFMWAFGYGQKSNRAFFIPSTEFKTDQKILIENTFKTK